MAGRKRKTFYVTTPIYYVNDIPHIGHAYTTIAADVLARYKRLTGHEVFFLTGTDEHGQKVEKAAAERGESPKQLADRVMPRFQKLWERLNISNDKFIRTTDADHCETVRSFFKKVRKKDDIYLGQYEDWYCISDEAYWTELQLVDGKCPTCGRAVEKIQEESYFFRLSKYQKQLLYFLTKQPNFIKPQSRRNEVIRFVEGGLRDLSVSRISFRWGIPVPEDDRHVIYVWFDALTNYLTAIGFGKDQKRFSRFWPADVHIIGKDILRFHAVYWPSFLFSAGLKPPKQIFSHGWWTVDGEKMSKSKGNVVDPNAMIDRYGVDPFRYFLLREVPFGEDGDFSETALVQRINSELANDLGNLFSRALTMLERYHQGTVPQLPSGKTAKRNAQLKPVAEQLYSKVKKEMEGFQFHLALKEIWQLVDLANRYIEQSAPWDLAKHPDKQTELKTVLYNSAEALRILSLYLFPFMPKTAQEMARRLGLKTDWEKIDLKSETKWGRLKPGTRIEKGSQLFPRIETNQTTEPPKQKPQGSTPQAAGSENLAQPRPVANEGATGTPARGVGASEERSPHGAPQVISATRAPKKISEQREREGEAPSALPMEGATLAPKNISEQREREGEAPSALPMEGATLAPKNISEQREREGEAPSALPMEGATLAPKNISEQREREGEAPSALPMEGATRAPKIKEKTVQTESATTEQIGIEEFKKIHLHVGKIESAEKVPGSEKLLKLTVDIGTEKRQVVAGIAKRYQPEDLIGKKVIVVTNLKPAKLMGIESQGMILAAGDKDVLGLATFLEDIPPGSKVK